MKEKTNIFILIIMIISASVIIGLTWNLFIVTTYNPKGIILPTITWESGNTLTQIDQTFIINYDGKVNLRQENHRYNRTINVETKLTNDELLVIDNLLQELDYSSYNKPILKNKQWSPGMTSHKITIMNTSETANKKWERIWSDYYYTLPEDILELHSQLDSIVNRIILDQN